MSIRIRLANFDSDRIALIKVLGRNLTTRSDQQRFSWLYNDSPFGVAQTWLATDDENGEIVGAGAAFPRKVHFDGKERLGLVLGDFCMDEKYRSVGPSLQLQRACMNAISQGPFEFFYDFPSKGMAAIYSRLGVHPTEHLVRWAKPLRVEGKLERVLGSKGLARSLAPVANTYLARRGWQGNEDACVLQVHDGPCGEEFTKLDELLGKRLGMSTARTAAYLNWRYLSNPCCRYQLLTARKAGTLLGYAVYMTSENDSTLVDLHSMDHPNVIARLLHGVVEHLRALGAVTVILHAGSGHPWSRLFERTGFRRRESDPVVVQTRQGSAVHAANLQRDWFLMYGDRDS
jgi:hypothetical protein